MQSDDQTIYNYIDNSEQLSENVTVLDTGCVLYYAVEQRSGDKSTLPSYNDSIQIAVPLNINKTKPNRVVSQFLPSSLDNLPTYSQISQIIDNQAR